jgi:hypothetical protein
MGLTESTGRGGRTAADLLTILGGLAAAGFVIGMGACLSSVLPHPTAWLTACAYLAPAALAFAAYWWITQRG